MSRKMYQGGSSRKQSLRRVIHELDPEPPRETHVKLCEWPSDEFMDRAGFKDEFYAYIKNAASRTSYRTNAYNIIISPIPSCGGLSFHLSVILLRSCLIFMMNPIPWT